MTRRALYWSMMLSDQRRSSIYQQIENAVNRVKLVQEDIISELLSKKLEEGYRRGENRFILDGIPRTLIQAEILDEVARRRRQPR